MLKKAITGILAGIAFVFATHTAIAQSYTDSLLTALNDVLDHKEEFVKVKQERIEQLQKRLVAASGRSAEERFKIMLVLASEYKTFIYDSAFRSLTRLQRVGYETRNPLNIAYAKVQLGSVMLSSGMFKEALDTLSTVNALELPDSVKIDYYFALGRTYYDLGDFNRDTYYTPYYYKLGSDYLDSARQLCPESSYLSLYLSSLKNLKTENSHQAHYDLTTLLSKYPLTPHERAVTASTLSYYHISRKETNEAINLLAIAAIADIQSATKEAAALPVLCELLYQKGDIRNAYPFVLDAMNDAVFYGAKQRKAQVGSIMPLITAAKVNNVEEQRRIALVYAALITLLTILVVVFAVSTLRHLNKRKRAERSLQEANKIKEEYIAYYFNVNSDYVNKLEGLKKAVEMKLMTKKVDDIKYVINGINLKKEREELYHSFDVIFVKIFPDFVAIFNSLFKEEDRIILKEGQLLNTELRIFALIRMGISDTEKIAKILDYSINTIYNYKTRVKSKSLISNDLFEKKIMEIQAY